VSLAALYRDPKQSPTAAVLGAYFSAWAATIETDPVKKMGSIRSAIDQAQRAVLLRLPPELAHDTASLMNELADELSGGTEEEKKLKSQIMNLASKLESM
jgi:hypothetical protein